MRSFFRWICGEPAHTQQYRKIMEGYAQANRDYNELAAKIAYDAVMNAIRKDWADNWHPDEEDWSINYRPQED